MKKWLSLFVVAVLALSTTACSSLPAKKDTMMAPYSKLLVKPLSFDENILYKVAGTDQEDFNKAQPALTKLFNENFSQTLPSTSYFDRALFEGTPDANTLVLETKVKGVDPGIKMVMTAWSVAQCRLVDGGTGKVLGSYVVRSESGRSAWSTPAGTIEKMFSDLGVNAAWYMVNAK